MAPPRLTWRVMYRAATGTTRVDLLGFSVGTAARFFKFVMGAVAGRGCLPKLRGREERLPFFDDEAWLRLVRLTPLGLTAAMLGSVGAVAEAAADEEGANVKGRASSERRRMVEPPKRERTTREKPEKVESLRFLFLFWCEMEVRLMVEFLIPPACALPEEEASTTMAWSPSWRRSEARVSWWWWVAMWARRATEEDERVMGRAAGRA